MAISMTIPTSYFSTVRRESSLVSYWRLNEVSGTRADDYGAKYGLNGIYDGAPVSDAALIYNDESAGSKLFGGTGKNVEIPDATPLRIIEDIAIEAWMVSYEETQTSAILTKLNSAFTFSSPYYLGMTSGKPFFSLGNGSGSTQITSPVVLPAGSVSHIVGTLSRKNLYIYINGKQVEKISLGSQAVKDEKQPVFIGALGNNTKRFNGLISEIALYNSGMSQKTAERHFDIGRQILTEPYYITTFDRPSYS